MITHSMTCRTCGLGLTKRLQRLDKLLERVKLNDGSFAPTMPVGFYAWDDEPSFRETDGAPANTQGCWVVNADDALALAPHPDPSRNSGCCGHDGADGPNRLCPGCGAKVATLSDDCWTYVELRFEPSAVKPGKGSLTTRLERDRTRGDLPLRRPDENCQRVRLPWRHGFSSSVPGAD